LNELLSYGGRDGGKDRGLYRVSGEAIIATEKKRQDDAKPSMRIREVTRVKRKGMLQGNFT